MAKKRIQNIVAESRFALPVTAVYALLMSMACGLSARNLWNQLAVLAVSSYLMVELNNANAIIRVYSRMVSCSYIVLFLMSGLLVSPVSSVLTQLCFIVFYMFFFRAYQNKSSMGLVFYAFLMIGLASTMSVHVFFLVPLMWILLFTNVLAGNIRSFFASVIGLVFPYWFLASYHIYTGNPEALAAHFSKLAEFGKLFDHTVLTDGRIMVLAMLALFMVVGIVHFHRNSYKDKIRTRMIYEIFSITGIYVMALLALQPNLYSELTGIMVVNTAPLIAHYIVFTNTRLTNVSFFVIVLSILLMTIYGIWMPS